MICDYVERDLDLYVDREIGPDGEAAIRDHLRSCAACRRRVADRESLGRLIRSLPYYSAPDRLRARVAEQVRRPRATPRLMAWAAAALAAAAIGSGIFIARSPQPSLSDGADPLLEQVVAGHVRSLQTDHLLDVQSTDQHTVKPWFLGKLDFAPPVADLAAAGFPLVGGRLDYVSGRPVAALVYERRRHTINVFVWPAADSPSPVSTRFVRGFHVRRWTRDGMAFWAVSDLNDAELAEFVRAFAAPVDVSDPAATAR